MGHAIDKGARDFEEQRKSEGMSPTDAMRHMVRLSGKPSSQVAREIGRTESFVRATISQGTRPRIDTFSQIAEACGYKVILRSEHDEFVLDVPAMAVTVEYSGCDRPDSTPSKR